MLHPLTEYDTQWIEDELDSLFDVAMEGARSVTYQSTSQSFSPTTGQHAVTTTDASVYAIRGNLRREERGVHETGTYLYLVRADDLSVTPKVGDRILDSSEYHEVEDVRSSALAQVWLLRVRTH